MSIIDIIIILLIIFGMALGFKRGFTRELVSCLGFILCIVGAFLLKNPVSAFMYEHLPFLSFGGIVKGVIVLNILVYEVLAFLIVLFLLQFIVKILSIATNVFEKILNATIILGIPSKILGAVLGGIKWVIISYIVLFALSLPIFNTNYIKDSKICSRLISYTPVISTTTGNTLKVMSEFETLKTKYEDNTDVNQFNLDSLDLFLKYNIIDIKSADKLNSEGKFKTVKNVDSVLNKYR